MSDLPLHINDHYASHFARVALSHITREYPNKLDHVLLDVSDVQSPRALHPVFYGSFDWHSSVHGYWLLARLYRTFPHIPECAVIRALFNGHITNENVAVEWAYAAHPSRAGFERPYGWAWLLQLCAELSRHQTDEGRSWSLAMAPLGAVFAKRFIEFLPRATYATRVGTHFNSAFATVLALDFAEADPQHAALRDALHVAAQRWFAHDVGATAWEPGGDDFLSPTLMEAMCMQRVLDARAFRQWFAHFLPEVWQGQPSTLFTPAIVSDRTDGKIAHLDGLNLSRAWCWRHLSAHWPSDSEPFAMAQQAASVHLRAGLPHVAGDYMGEHWLATFALLALEAPRGLA